MPNLTAKQESFARYYALHGNASEAYRQSYDCKKISAEAIAIEGHKLTRHPKVAQMIADIRAELAKSHMVTMESVSHELEEARNLAMLTGNSSAAVAASMGKAKLHGLVVEKKDINLSLTLADMVKASMAKGDAK